MGAVRRLLFCSLLVAVATLGTDPALAHGDEGALEVVDAVPTSAGDEVTYTLELTYANDGDPVDGAIVSATVRGPGGPREPIALASIGEGWYAGPVLFPGPGRWTVAFAAIEPAATIEATYEVPATPPTTTMPLTTTTEPTADDPEPAVNEVDIDDGPPAGLIIGAVVAGAALVAAAVVLILRRRSPD